MWSWLILYAGLYKCIRRKERKELGSSVSEFEASFSDVRRRNMASLMLLLGALMRWHQNFFTGEGWRGEQYGAEDNLRGNGDTVPGMQYDYASGPVKEEDEAQTWKIADCCIWP